MSLFRIEFRRRFLAECGVLAILALVLVTTRAPGEHLDSVPNPLTSAEAEPEREPLTILVMDPWALPLSCACVQDFGQRDYSVLQALMSEEIDQRVELLFEESLGLAMQRPGPPIDVVIGKDSVVRFDAQQNGVEVRPLMSLTDHSGKSTLHGTLFVRNDSPIETLVQLKDRRLALGPAEDADSHAAAQSLLRMAELDKSIEVSVHASLESAAYAVIDGEADAAALPTYFPRLWEGCGKIGPGELRGLADTDEVPFVQLFATARITDPQADRLVSVLSRLSHQEELRVALESDSGFVAIPKSSALSSWSDWRGPGRAGRVLALPRALPDTLRVIWTAPVTGPALAGIAATSDYTVTAMKDEDATVDIFQCRNARNGLLVWELKTPSAGHVDYSNAPRATPVIDGNLVYLQGVWGELHCVQLQTGRVIWERNLLKDFGAEPLTWGCSQPPLVVDGRVIVSPGAPDASVVALDGRTGQTLWKTPGHAAAYGAFITGTFGGKRQIVGYDVAGLGGWDITTGERLWSLIPRGLTDFNVGTPVDVEDRLLVATENNATRLYDFDNQGRIIAKPVATNGDLAPDTCTPVITRDRFFCTAFGEMYCVDRNTLRTIWSQQDDRFYDHTNLIAGADRVLVWTTHAELMLIDAHSPELNIIDVVRPFAESDGDSRSLSHPAIVGNRLYVRNELEMLCLELPVDVTVTLDKGN